MDLNVYLVLAKACTLRCTLPSHRVLMQTQAHFLASASFFANIWHIFARECRMCNRTMFCYNFTPWLQNYTVSISPWPNAQKGIKTIF